MSLSDLEHHTGTVETGEDIPEFVTNLPPTRQFDLTLVSATYSSPKLALEEVRHQIARRRKCFEEDLRGIAVAEEDPEDDGSLVWIALTVPPEVKALDSLGVHAWLGATSLVEAAEYETGTPLFSWEQVSAPEALWRLEASLAEDSTLKPAS